jgi:DNA-binding LacI/PurR family transcriptional regulator
MVTEYLISLGHTDIVHLAGAPEASTSNERISGYKRAMIAHQLTRYTHIIEANFLQKDAYEKVKLLLAERTPHAIFCANDSSAAGAYRAIQEHSLLIPDDISIIGYGNQAIGMQLNPPLTSVNQGPQIIGQIAAMILLTQMNSGHHESGCIRIPAALIFRGSCRSRHQS